jgi:mannitol/fructose-specific phosphotransferase system IIA component (Ntr-type)
MRIVELFNPRWMTMNLQAAHKWEAIQELAGVLFEAGRVSSLEEYMLALSRLARPLVHESLRSGRSAV